MKRYLLFIGAVATILLGTVAVAHAADMMPNNAFMTAATAENNLPMTEAHVDRIRQNCSVAQTVLYQLHASDGVLRVNRGQLYESIVNDLMAPLNSRIVLNQLDASSLVAITNTYNSQFTTFNNDYQQYEESMSQTLALNCQKQPVTFFDDVNVTSALRQTVHSDVLALNASLDAYKAAFEVFAKNNDGSTQ